MNHPAFVYSARQLTKSFDGFHPIFPPIDVNVNNGDIIGITGWNGSGKSTLMNMLAGILTPQSGTIELCIADRVIDYEFIPMHIGFIAPYLTVYEDFSPKEHAQMFCSMSGIAFDEALFDFLIDLTGLYNYQHGMIRTFSSGMKQRVKYVLAMIRNSPILLLDEPSTNLDEKGQEIFKNIIRIHKEHGGGTIIATNEYTETLLCDSIISLS